MEFQDSYSNMSTPQSEKSQSKMSLGRPASKLENSSFETVRSSSDLPQFILLLNLWRCNRSFLYGETSLI